MAASSLLHHLYAKLLFSLFIFSTILAPIAVEASSELKSRKTKNKTGGSNSAAFATRPDAFLALMPLLIAVVLGARHRMVGN